MQKLPNGKTFLEELREFLRFLQSLWGILAGISVLFPLSNGLVQVIPLITTNHRGGEGSGGLWFIPPLLVTTITTLSALFMILSTFGQRHTFKGSGTRRLIQQQAWLSFTFSLLAVLVYHGVITLLEANDRGERFGWAVRDPRWFITDTILLLCYATFFTLMTRAFELLAMMEYFGGDSQLPSTPSKRVQ
jgi:hypothetical protein